jgi:hypothetical protein
LKEIDHKRYFFNGYYLEMRKLHLTTRSATMFENHLRNLTLPRDISKQIHNAGNLILKKRLTSTCPDRYYLDMDGTTSLAEDFQDLQLDRVNTGLKVKFGLQNITFRNFSIESFN